MSPEPERIRELVLRARSGDEMAFGELVRSFEAAVLRLAARITGDPAEAEDAAQEAFLRAYQALPRFDPDRPFGPWIMKIAANRALTHAAHRRKDVPLDESAPGPDFEKEQADKSEAERIKSAVAGMPPSDRAVLSLRYDSDLPLSEIARTLGIGLSAVKVRLFRARQRLMRLMGTEG
ncbi:MAG: sigma-70 family RNA polymerase sigma factor [Elusimicrobiota bacterium]